jgi:hypothetical protein
VEAPNRGVPDAGPERSGEGPFAFLLALTLTGSVLLVLDVATDEQVASAVG